MTRPTRADSDGSDPGAAQFIQKLSSQQLHHLQFALPPKDAPERFSQFLERPRRSPVPNRFAFDPPNSEARLNKEKAEKEQHKREKSVGKSAGGTPKLSFSPSLNSMEGSGPQSIPKAAESTKKVKELDWKFYISGVAMALLNLMAAWDATSLTLALPTIAKDLSGSALDSFWLVTSFLVAATVFLPLFATCSDVFGRKPMLLSALVFSSAGSFISAVTGNFTGLHLGRCIQGLGAGGLAAVSNLIITDLPSEGDGRIWSATAGATWAIGAITGPIIGGVLAEKGQWRWMFWINLPFTLLALLVLLLTASFKTGFPSSKMPKFLWRVDWLGYIFFAGSLISVLLGITWGGTQHPWSNIATALPIFFGIVGASLFLVWSYFSSFDAIIDLSEFLDPTSLATYLGAALHGLVVIVALYFLPLFFATARSHHGLLEIGVWLFPWTVTLAVAALVTVVVISKGGYWRPAVWAGWFLTTLGLGLTTLFNKSTATAVQVTIAVVTGCGFGVLFPSLKAASISACEYNSEDAKRHKATTNYAFFQLLGQTLGVAVGSSVFQNMLYKQVLKSELLHRLALHYTQDAVVLVALMKDMPLEDGGVRFQLQEAYVNALRPLWVVLAATAGLALVVSFALSIKGRKPQPRGVVQEAKDLEDV